jgi:predicted extracellular nuclease
LEAAIVVDGQPYTIYVNHFKSKSGGESETAAQRLAQAAHLRSLVAARLEAEPDARVIAVGDFNDYPLSAPLQTLTAGNMLVNILLRVPRQERYSYIFGGASQLLDMVLVSPSVVDEVALTTIVHVNADYPAGWANDPKIPFHVSDHDIPLVVFSSATVPPESATAMATATALATPGAVQTQAAGLGQSWVLLVVIVGFVAVAIGALLVLRGRRNQ